MPSRYESICYEPELQKHFGIALRSAPAAELRRDVVPGCAAPFLRRPKPGAEEAGTGAAREMMVGLFGLLPHWAKDDKLARSTHNAHSETVATHPTFRDAWSTGKRCIIPVQAFHVSDWRTGQPLTARIARADHRPMGVAGLWSWWRSPAGNDVLSFTMLTINARSHELMRNFLRPEDEKRVIVVLDEVDYDPWLQAPVALAKEFLRPWAPGALVSSTGLRS